MSSYRRTLVAAVIALAPTSMMAQLPPCGVLLPSAFRLAWRRVIASYESISPAQFQGRGPQVSLATQHSLRGTCFGASLHGAAATLSAMGGSAASETLSEVDGSLTALRPLGSASSMAISGELRGSLTGTTHRYADPGRRVAGYRSGIVSVGRQLAGATAPCRWICRARWFRSSITRTPSCWEEGKVRGRASAHRIAERRMRRYRWPHRSAARWE